MSDHTEDCSIPPQAQSIARGLLLLAIVVTLGVTIVRAYFFFRFDYALDHVAGVWLALANDLAHGIFYRPVFDPSLGYGGTRYFPLEISMMAGLVKAGMDVRTSGHLVSLLSTVALVIGIYWLSRRLGASRLVSWGAAVLILATRTAQLSLDSVRGDALPLALSVWGLALCTGPVGLGGLLAAAILFSLAFSAKVTAVAGFGAAALALLAKREYRQAATLIILTVCGYVAVLTAMFVASSGRAFAKAGAVAGSGIGMVLKAPLRFTVVDDPATVFLAALAVPAIMALPRGQRAKTAPLFFIVSAIVTAAILSRPGTEMNHVIELAAASLLVIAAASPVLAPAAAEMSLAILALGCMLFLGPLSKDVITMSEEPPIRRYDRTVSLLKSRPGPLLSENALIPVLDHQLPYVLDPFMYRTITLQDPRFGDPLIDKIQSHWFKTILLVRNPEGEAGRAWYTYVHFGPGFLKALQSNYQSAGHVDGLYIYTPRA